MARVWIDWPCGLDAASGPELEQPWYREHSGFFVFVCYCAKKHNQNTKITHGKK